jgi:hypothetical protein
MKTRVAFLLLLYIGLFAQIPIALARSIEYRYVGNLTDQNQRIVIDFKIDTSLISTDGHFDQSDNFEISSTLSPFASFTMSGGGQQVDDSRYNPADVDFRISKGAHVVFDADSEGHILNWSIQAVANNAVSHVIDFYYQFDSTFNTDAPNNDTISSGAMVFDEELAGFQSSSQVSTSTVAGNWTYSVIPIPGSLVLFSSALLLGLMLRTLKIGYR